MEKHMAKSYTRVREQATDDVLTHYYASGSFPLWDGGAFLTGRSVASMTDVVTPGYKQLIAQGAIINNPCTYHKYTITGGGGTDYHTNSGHTIYWTGSGAVSEYYYNADEHLGMWTGLDWGIPTSSAARAKALALSNIDSTPYAFGEDTLEIRETLRFIRSPLGSLANLGKNFKSDVRKAKRLQKRTYSSKARRVKDYARTAKAIGESQTKAVADVWLSYQFAASPLVRSLADALDAYVVEAPAIPVRRNARGFSEDEVTVRDQSKVLAVGPGDTRTYSLERFVSHDYHASILYEVTNPVHDLKWKLGFRLKDLPTTLWQIVPLSFMIDRVWDVTSFSKGIINLSDPKVKILSAAVRLKQLNRESYQIVGETNDIYTGFNQGGKHVEEEFLYQRDPWIPSVVDTVPQTSLKTLVDSASKIADLAALVRARFS